MKGKISFYELSRLIISRKKYFFPFILIWLNIEVLMYFLTQFIKEGE